jgi:predicted AlkP superfamily phosphohydrolase/phosphomutase
MKRLALIGLDCADPTLLGRLLPELPTLRGLVESGSFTRLRSVDPPITVPAWMCMMTGKDPGQLGVYGFRNRLDHSYESLQIVDSNAFSDAIPIWDTLSLHGRRSILLGIPGTYPPRPVAGRMVTGLLTPVPGAAFTYPPTLKESIQRWVGDFVFDVSAIETEDESKLIDRIHGMTAQRFEVARRLATCGEWDLFAMVEMGPDRMHHAFWSHHDPLHPNHDPMSPYRDAIRNYYRLLDAEISSLLEVLPDNTHICIASDHGAQRLEGGVAINEWLIREGHLALKEYPAEPTRIEDLIERGLVEWDKTTAWGAGGYYGRIFFNVAGREPRGVVPPARYSVLQDEIAAGIEAIPDEDGASLRNRVLRPSTTYRAVRGTAPDLLAYFGNLSWRSIGTVGWNRVHLRGENAGPGTANHSPEGIFLSSQPTGRDNPHSILQVYDFILGQFGISER